MLQMSVSFSDVFKFDSYISVLGCFLFFLPGLFPAVLNLATMADIKANATCGLNGPEMSCKLVEHVPGQPVRNPQCTICDQESTNEYGKELH